LLAADWLVSLKIYSFEGKISLTLLQTAWPLGLLNVFSNLNRILHRPLTLFFRGLVGGKAQLPPRGEGGGKMQTILKKRKKERKKKQWGKKSKENLGTCLVPPHPAPSKNPKQCKTAAVRLFLGFLRAACFFLGG
jgi:hypothetical protein